MAKGEIQKYLQKIDVSLSHGSFDKNYSILVDPNIVSKPNAYDLAERTFLFAKNIRLFLREVAGNDYSAEDKRQLLRSSGSVAANYVEASEAISRKDFFLRIRICRKEAKESHFWLRLIEEDVDLKNKDRGKLLIQEALELSRIFGAIAKKSTD